MGSIQFESARAYAPWHVHMPSRRARRGARNCLCHMLRNERGAAADGGLGLRETDNHESAKLLNWAEIQFESAWVHAHRHVHMPGRRARRDASDCWCHMLRNERGAAAGGGGWCHNARDLITFSSGRSDGGSILATAAMTTALVGSRGRAAVLFSSTGNSWAAIRKCRHCVCGTLL